MTQEAKAIVEVTVPAREGRGVRVPRGAALEVVDLEGKQVGDLVAWSEADPTVYLSPAHTVSCNASVRLTVGGQLFSNHRDPMFTILRDDVGEHDLVVPCCDPERYSRDYGIEGHGSCLENLEQARRLLEVERDLHGEMAWNVFMHNRITDDGRVVTDPASHAPGSRIALRAEMNLIVLLSACPQDLTPCNNFDPTSMQLRVLPGA
jgi:uncharacterized protein YcgI (DUF1989 family)